MSLIQAFRPVSSQDVTAGEAADSVTVPGGVSVVRICAEGTVRVALDSDATETSVRVAADIPEYFLCNPGSEISLIRDGSTDVKVNIAFMSR